MSHPLYEPSSLEDRDELWNLCSGLMVLGGIWGGTGVMLVREGSFFLFPASETADLAIWGPDSGNCGRAITSSRVMTAALHLMLIFSVSL